MLSETAKDARREGVETFTCVTLEENRRILSLVRCVFSDVHISYAAGALLIRAPLSRSGA